MASCRSWQLPQIEYFASRQKSREYLMLDRPIDFYYFTGTGNTLLIVQKMAEVFNEHSIPVNLHRIENEEPLSINTEHILGLAFPVAYQSTYPFIRDFFLQLPHAHKTPVFMVDTMYAFSGAIVGHLKKILTKKGYCCIGATEIIMPNNFLVTKMNNKKKRDIIMKGLRRADQFANELFKGTAIWPRVPILADLSYKVCTMPALLNKTMQAVSKNLTVDHETCNGCKLCVNLCPVGNITKNSTIHIHGECQLCLRCFSYCPNLSITFKGKSYLRYKALSARQITHPVAPLHNFKV